MPGAEDQSLKQTPLHALHVELGAKMVPFAGYDMPVQYPAGVLKEHLHTRAAAGLFDVSHMGQVRLAGDDPAAALETLVPGDMLGLAAGSIRYTLLTNDAGGIRDDLMVSNAGDHMFLVINAACKHADIAHLQDRLTGRAEVAPLGEWGLLALQGPAAATVMARLSPGADDMAFMTARALVVDGIACIASRSGYTGEDGFEISVAPDKAEALARALLAAPEVEPIGLGARDSLRLEAGLCLYGHDIDESTTPIEAALAWTIAKRRRTDGGFPGADKILAQLRDGAPRRRVGIKPDGRAPAREHAHVVDAEGRRIGEVTSGGFGPSADGPVAMGYVETAHAAADTAVGLVVRGKTLPARVVKLPFVQHNYYRG